MFATSFLVLSERTMSYLSKTFFSYYAFFNKSVKGIFYVIIAYEHHKEFSHSEVFSFEYLCIDCYLHVVCLYKCKKHNP